MGNMRALPALNNHEKRVERLEAKPPGVTLGEVYAQFGGIPGLRGFWPMSSQDEYGDALDLSGQGRVMYYNGNPTYNQYNALAPYLEFDATGDYLHRPAEFGLQITGLEAYYATAVRGLTVGGWFWTDDTPGGTEGHITHQDGTNAGSHFDLYTDASLASIFRVYNGANNAGVTLAAGMPVASWNWQVGRFVPGASVDVYTNATKTTTATAFASANTSLANFVIGGYNTGTLLMDGRAALVFLSANALSDAYINLLYNRSRMLFGA